jgi:hypothetical protein
MPFLRALCGLALYALVGCAGAPEGTDTETGSHRDRPPVSTTATQSRGAKQPQRHTDRTAVESSRAGNRGPGSRTLTTAGGVVVSTPPRPAWSRVGPSHTCVKGAPPTPGVEGRRLDGPIVELRWAFRRNPPSCRAVRLLVIADVSDDTAAGVQTVFKVTALHGTARIPLPEDLRAADVLRVKALTSRGVESPTAAISIAG